MTWRRLHNLHTPLQLDGDRLIFVGLLLLLVALPWPRGSNLPAAESLIGLTVGLLLCAWAVQSLRRRLPSPRLNGPSKAALALSLLWILWNAGHLIPLTPETLRVLSPAAADVHQSLTDLGLPALHTLSIAPGETLRQLLLTTTYAGLYLLTLLLCGSRSRQRIVLITVVTIGLAQALYAVQAHFSGLDLFGTGRDDGRASGSFVNPNHLAAYLELALAAGLGLVLADLRGWSAGNWRNWVAQLIDLSFSTKFRIRIFLIAIVVALVLTQSRMGNAAFFISLCVCGSLYLLLRRRQWLGRGLLLFGSVLLIDLWIVSDRFGLQRVVERIEQTQLGQEERPLVLADLAPVFENHVQWGAGLGGFEDAYSPYRDAAITKRYDHAHNEYAEFLIDAGAPGVLLIGLLTLLHLWHFLRVIVRRREPLRSGVAFAALMALIAVLVHALAEFLLHIPAVAASFVVLMALGIRVSSRGHRPAAAHAQMA